MTLQWQNLYQKPDKKTPEYAKLKPVRIKKISSSPMVKKLVIDVTTDCFLLNKYIRQNHKLIVFKSPTSKLIYLNLVTLFHNMSKKKLL